MTVQPQDGQPVLLSSIIEAQGVSGLMQIRSCGIDSREQLESGLFVSLGTDPTETLEEVERAYKRGAVAVAVRRGIFPPETELPHYVFEVNEPLETFGIACQALYGNPGQKIKLIGITGTSGKTSLSYVIAGMLAESGSPVGLIGSLGVYDGNELVPGMETTPTADRLAQRLAEMVRNGCTHAIVEVSGAALVSHRLAGLRFDAICLTNIRRDHLEHYRSLEDYRKTKMRIFDYADEKTLVVCNADDRVTQAVLHLIHSPTITVGMHPSESMVSGMLVEQNRGGQTFYLVAGIDAVPVHTKIIGKEHIYNCLLAAALGICWEIDLKMIVPGLERVEHVPGRLEQIDCGQPFAVFVDNASTPESFEASLATLQTISTGKIYCVLGVPSGEDRSKRPLIGRAAQSFADMVVVTSGSYSREATAEALDDILKGFDSAEQQPRTVAKRKDAIAWALSDAGPDDIVLIVGNDQTVGLESEQFVPDRQFVRSWLYDNQSSLEPFWY